MELIYVRVILKIGKNIMKREFWVKFYNYFLYVKVILYFFCIK